MLGDKFVMMWKADTTQAQAAIDQLEKSADSAAKNTGKALEEAIRALTSAAQVAVKDLQATAQNTQNAASQAVDTANEADRRAESSKRRKRKTAALLGGTGREEARREASQPSQQSQPAIKVDRLTVVANNATVLAGGSGAPKSRRRTKEKSDTASVFLGNVLAKVFTSVGDKIVSSITNGIKNAWEAGKQSEGRLNEAAYAGFANMGGFEGAKYKLRSAGISDENAAKSISGLGARALEAKSQPWGEANLRFRQAGISTAGGAEKVVERVLEKVRSFPTAFEGASWAANRLGMDFETMRRYAEMSADEIEKSNEGQAEYTKVMGEAGEASKQLGKAQGELGVEWDKLKAKLATGMYPTLTKITEAVTTLVSKLDPVAEGFNKIVQGLTDAFTSDFERLGKDIEEKGFFRGAWKWMNDSLNNQDQAWRNVAHIGMNAAGIDIPKDSPTAQDQAKRDEEAEKTRKQILKTTQESKKSQDLMAKHMVPPIPVKPVQLGLEQALSLWASGMGQQGKLNAPSDAEAATTRGKVEEMAMHAVPLKMNVQYDGSLVAGSDATSKLFGGKGNINDIANLQARVDETMRMAKGVENKGAVADRWNYARFDPVAQHNMYYGTDLAAAERNAASVGKSGAVHITVQQDITVHGSKDLARDVGRTAGNAAGTSVKNAVNHNAGILTK